MGLQNVKSVSPIQLLKSYTHDVFGKAGLSPITYIISVINAFQPELLHRIMYE
jgi:hypothetical protein